MGVFGPKICIFRRKFAFFDVNLWTSTFSDNFVTAQTLGDLLTWAIMATGCSSSSISSECGMLFIVAQCQYRPQIVWLSARSATVSITRSDIYFFSSNTGNYVCYYIYQRRLGIQVCLFVGWLKSHRWISTQFCGELVWPKKWLEQILHRT